MGGEGANERIYADHTLAELTGLERGLLKTLAESIYIYGACDACSMRFSVYIYSHLRAVKLAVHESAKVSTHEIIPRREA